MIIHLANNYDITTYSHGYRLAKNTGKLKKIGDMQLPLYVKKTYHKNIEEALEEFLKKSYHEKLSSEEELTIQQAIDFFSQNTQTAVKKMCEALGSGNGEII